MEIYFSQSYDAPVYSETTLFNKTIVGPDGLLRLLEREFGIIPNELSDIERKCSYRIVLEKYLTENDKAFYRNSFKVDPAGVTNELLKFRDELVLNGIIKEKREISPRIDTLIDIEEIQNISGTADRWRHILDVIKNHGGLKNIEAVFISEPEDLLHPFYKDLFDALADSVTIAYNNNSYPTGESDLYKIQKVLNGETDSIELDNDGSIQIWQFNTPLEIILSLTAKESPIMKERHILINQYYHELDTQLESLGIYHTGTASHHTHPVNIQLFKTLTVLFTGTTDITALIAYLQTDIHPVPSRLRYQLLNILSMNGGFGKNKWKEAIDDYEFKNEHQKNTTLLFTTIIPSENGKINKEKVLNLYRQLADWAVTRIHTLQDSEQVTKNHLDHIRRMCNGLIKVLDSNSEETPDENFIKNAVYDIYDGTIVSNTELQRLAPYTIQDPGNLFDVSKKTIWFDFYNSDLSPYINRNFRKAEREILQNFGYKLWADDKQTSWKLWKQQQPFFKTSEKLILINCKYCRSERVIEHPIMTLLKSKLKDEIKKITQKPDLRWATQELEAKAISTETMELKGIDPLSKISLREQESSSSLEKLIYYPFDWVLQYGLDIYAYQPFGSNDTFTAMGSAAHSYVELLFNRSAFNLDEAFVIHKEKFNEIFQESIHMSGLILLLKQHISELTNFKRLLEENVEGLLVFIKENKLKPAETEKELKEELLFPGSERQVISGYIDLLLKDEKGGYVILDMKWTWSTKKYSRKIENGADIQLVLYKKLLAQAISGKEEQIRTLYCILSENKFITRHSFSGKNIQRISDFTDDEVFQRLKNSVKYRLNQFNQKLLETGEKQPVADLLYFNDQESENLIPLDLDGSGNKKQNYYSYAQLFKGNVS